jgi:signal transduction histidine kinase
VVLNLECNAAPAAGAGAEAARIELTTRARGGVAELCVADNGPGIPAELLEQIFDPGYTTRALGSGTGLGLALVRLIVKRHGGDIQAESGRSGTCVRVRLPSHAPGAPA